MLAITEETTPDDLLRSLDGPNWTERAKSVERIAALYCEGELDPVTRRRVEDAFRALRYDGEDLIRRLLAECLKDAVHLPRDVAFGKMKAMVEGAKIVRAELAGSRP